MLVRKMMVGIVIALIATSCATPQLGAQVAPVAAVATPTATRVRTQRPTGTPAAMTTAMPTVTPTIEITAVPTATPTAMLQLSPTATATALPTANAGAGANPAPVASGVLLALDPLKYAAPVLLAPGDNAAHHVAQPVVHLAWSATPTDLLKFGQVPACVSDATNFRRAYESYQLIFHNLDGIRPDQVQWTDNNPSFDLNLTTVPAGRYSWKVNVVTLCESYVVGQRNDTLPWGKAHYDDPAYHKSTLQTTLVGAVSPWSTTHIINWVP